MAWSCSASRISLEPSSRPAPVPLCLSTCALSPWPDPPGGALPGCVDPTSPASPLAEADSADPCFRFLPACRPSCAFACCPPDPFCCGLTVESRFAIESLSLFIMLKPALVEADSFSDWFAAFCCCCDPCFACCEEALCCEPDRPPVSDGVPCSDCSCSPAKVSATGFSSAFSEWPVVPLSAELESPDLEGLPCAFSPSAAFGRLLASFLSSSRSAGFGRT